MESYQVFLNRVSVFEKEIIDLGKSYFRGRPSLAYKIDKSNKIQDFFGDTIVFDLDTDIKRKISQTIDELYSTSPECFAERLSYETLHMTLHDLSNAPHLDDISDDMEKNMTEVIRRAPLVKNMKIKMKTNFIFNMVNTSLVLGLIPINGDEYQKLMELHSLFDTVKRTEYPLTPHITLAYYNINGFDQASAKKLESKVNSLNRHINIEIELDTNKLFYQRFTSMNKYKNTWNIGRNSK
jgi:2'-5' RNA ligase